MSVADTVSVLLPVHAGVEPDHFATAVGSLLSQDREPDEIVVVADGPLSAGHETVMATLRGSSVPVTVRRLRDNQGAGAANQAGLEVAVGTWVVKADADDVCVPHRIAVQLRALAATGADLCGAAMGEFDVSPDHVRAVRRNPLTHVAIARRMRVNNPVNHPTVVYRRELAVSVGGYRAELRYMQDYDLFARLLVGGARMLNLEDVLVHFRAGDAMLGRRRNPAMRACEATLQRHLHDYGLIGPVRRRANLAVRQGFRALPVPVLRMAYAVLLNEPVRRP